MRGIGSSPDSTSKAMASRINAPISARSKTLSTAHRRERILSAETDRLERGVAVGGGTGDAGTVLSIISIIGSDLFGLSAECGILPFGCPRIPSFLAATAPN